MMNRRILLLEVLQSFRTLVLALPANQHGAYSHESSCWNAASKQMSSHGDIDKEHMLSSRKGRKPCMINLYVELLMFLTYISRAVSAEVPSFKLSPIV